MKNFIVIKETFTCLKCGKKNPLLEGTCRNHCMKCLYSQHLDENTPGDRLSNCHGLMEPISLDQTGKKGYKIFHKCLECGKILPNKAAPDDDFNELIELSKKNYL
ncbi:MAG: RNHCP domain-containing protein [Patescibacteria group bacterium]